MQWRAELFEKLFPNSMLVQQCSMKTRQQLQTRRTERQQWVQKWEEEKAAVHDEDSAEPTFKSLRTSKSVLGRCPIKQETATMAYSTADGVHHTVSSDDAETWGKGGTSSWRVPYPFFSETTWQQDRGISVDNDELDELEEATAVSGVVEEEAVDDSREPEGVDLFLDETQLQQYGSASRSSDRRMVLRPRHTNIVLD
eukprot:SAG31_NODE_9283_length_1304_cov_1.513693_2_plen_198_part_00